MSYQTHNGFSVRVYPNLLSIFFVVISFVIGFISIQPVEAAAYVVSKTADTDDGVCDADCSLREAITAANASAGDDTITFAAGANGTIALTSALPGLSINGAITITGNGPGNTIISGNNAVRGFSMDVNSTATLNDLTVTNGFSSGNGGGIYASGRYLTLNNVHVINSHATSEGGGIFINAGHNRADINNSRFTGNRADVGGGGIGSLAIEQYIRNTLVANNSAPEASGVYGAVLTDLYVYNSTITNNIGSSYGGLTTFYFVRLFNTIVANNNGGGATDCYGLVFESSTNLIEDGTCGASSGTNGSLMGDPALNSDYTLSATSPAINAGNNTYAPAGTDLAGNVRIHQGTVDIGAYEAIFSSVDVQLTLQARPTAPNNAYIVTGNVEVRPVGGGSPVLATTFTSDNMGRFTLTNILVGTYDIWVKGSHTLARLQNFTLVEGGSTMTTALLLEGDANDDNFIDVLDFSVLSTAFGTLAGDPLYDARADFNQDGLVALVDFSLLASNFALAGDD